MKATRIIILALALLLGLGNAMAQEDCNRAQKAPQTKETVLTKSTRTKKGYDTYQAAYKAALREAAQAYPNKEVGIRNLKKGDVKVNGDGSVSNYYNYTIVELPGVVAQNLFNAISQATREIDAGNRFALDRLTILDEQTDRQLVRSNIIDYLIGRGYKVVAKEYLLKLKEEIDGQGSGLYNPSTTVKPGNFSAVGYFLSVRVDYSYVQVEVVNVSTGEFEGNVTVNL